MVAGMEHARLTSHDPRAAKGHSHRRQSPEDYPELADGQRPGSLAMALAMGSVRGRADSTVVGAADDPVEDEADDLARRMSEPGAKSCGCDKTPGGACRCPPRGA